VRNLAWFGARAPQPDARWRAAGAQNVYMLQQLINEAGRIIPRKASGACKRHQREVTKAVKQARFLGLLGAAHAPMIAPAAGDRARADHSSNWKVEAVTREAALRRARQDELRRSVGELQKNVAAKAAASTPEDLPTIEAETTQSEEASLAYRSQRAEAIVAELLQQDARLKEDARRRAEL
jgi:ribosomal protein S18